MNLIWVRSTELLSSYFGETEAIIRQLFARARLAAPCVLFFDEFDAIAMKRGLSSDQGDQPAFNVLLVVPGLTNGTQVKMLDLCSFGSSPRCSTK